MKLKIKKGDVVSVIAGSNKGKTGKVLNVDAKNLRILVEGVNVCKRHTKASQKNPQGGVLAKEKPIAYSNVLLLDSQGKPTRIGVKTAKKGSESKSVRFAKTTGQELTA